MKKTMLWVAVALLMTACSMNDGAEEKPEPVICPPAGFELTRGEQELVNHGNDFAFNLFREVAQEDKSLMLSPVSITYALGMLNNGAAGETQQQINKVLGFTEAGEVNNFCQKMLYAAPNLDPQTKVMIANTIYMNQPYELKPAFVQTANDYYQAQPETRDFHDGKTMDVINQWASDHTERMIEKVLDEQSFNPDAVSYLLNAIYFKGEWSQKFDKGDTREELFDNRVNVNMMHLEHQLPYAEKDDYQVLSLPYGNESYSMTILLPKEGKTIADVTKDLTAEGWSKMWNTGVPYEGAIVDVKLPRFETQTELDLNKLMSRLGMPLAFDPEHAEFPDFCNVATYIGLMKQVARIKLSEEGTEAAAVTVIGVNLTSAGPTPSPVRVNFHATRPFLYVISERSTGAIFFIGQYLGK